MAKINSMQKRPKFYTPTKKKALLLLVVLFIAAGVLFMLEKRGVINLYDADPVGTQDQAKTTSNTKTAQEDFNDGEFREPGNSLNENEGSGAITDNNGSIGDDIDTSTPIVSSTGEITVYTPKSETTIKSGYKVTGKSTLPKVSYRLIDSITGVISSGELSVVNGSFSGSISYTTNANEGRLDIYGTRDDGSEFSNIEVTLRFMQ